MVLPKKYEKFWHNSSSTKFHLSLLMMKNDTWSLIQLDLWQMTPLFVICNASKESFPNNVHLKEKWDFILFHTIFTKSHWTLITWWCDSRTRWGIIHLSVKLLILLKMKNLRNSCVGILKSVNIFCSPPHLLWHNFRCFDVVEILLNFERWYLITFCVYKRNDGLKNSTMNIFEHTLKL